RALDPGARRHGVHVGAPAPPLLQASALALRPGRDADGAPRGGCRCRGRGTGDCLMDGLMMDFQLTLPHLLRRSETYYGNGEIVSRLPDKSLHRTTYRDTMRRARQLAVALHGLRLERGEPVA